ncbi:hypothetical protein [Streptomyces lavendofoliae]|uniref:ATP-dependent DNA ligase n=1 Tax=Streptomyces lavendofoliae TaxID=67314 RepID=UPI003D94E244
MDAAADLPDGLVLDGEQVVWVEGRLSFEALQRRAVSGGRTAIRLAQEMPAHFIAFDLLQLDGKELLHVPYGERRARLEQLFTDRGLSALWTLCPETTEVATAQEWLTSWTQVPGVEGLVIRGSGQRYLPGACALYKVSRPIPPKPWSARWPRLPPGRAGGPHVAHDHRDGRGRRRAGTRVVVVCRMRAPRSSAHTGASRADAATARSAWVAEGQADAPLLPTITHRQ